MDAIGLIIAERERQQNVERFGTSHDDQHVNEELSRAAACYAIPEAVVVTDVPMDGVRGIDDQFRYRSPGPGQIAWPWSGDDWKPTPSNRIRELVKAGALIVAEIERLQRSVKDD